MRISHVVSKSGHIFFFHLALRCFLFFRSQFRVLGSFKPIKWLLNKTFCSELIHQPVKKLLVTASLLGPQTAFLCSAFLLGPLSAFLGPCLPCWTLVSLLWLLPACFFGPAFQGCGAGTGTGTGRNRINLGTLEPEPEPYSEYGSGSGSEYKEMKQTTQKN
jgi:hypothetical protein